MPLYDYLTPKLDFKRKFNHRQSFLYKGRLTVRTIRKFESDHHYESNPESEVRFEIESNIEASQVPTICVINVTTVTSMPARYCFDAGCRHVLMRQLLSDRARSAVVSRAIVWVSIVMVPAVDMLGRWQQVCGGDSVDVNPFVSVSLCDEN